MERQLGSSAGAGPRSRLYSTLSFLILKFTYLFEKSEKERKRLIDHLSAGSPPHMIAMARIGPNQSQEQRAVIQVSHICVRAQILGPSSAAFPSKELDWEWSSQDSSQCAFGMPVEELMALTSVPQSQPRGFCLLLAL